MQDKLKEAVFNSLFFYVFEAWSGEKSIADKRGWEQWE